MPNPSIVDKLVRAAAAVPSDIPDDELNRHVAEILAKEAKEKESKWREMGIGVYLEDKPGSSSRAPKPNTRFLKSLVRDVDGHNTALLREQASAARAAAADKYYKDPNLRPENDERRASSRSGRSRPDQDSDVARMKRLFGGAVGSAASSRKSDNPGRNPPGSASIRHVPATQESRQPSSTSTGKSSGAAGSWRREAANPSARRVRDEDEASEDEEKGWSRKDVGRNKPRSALKRAEEEEEGERRRQETSEMEKEVRKRERERSRSPVSPGKRRANEDELNASSRPHGGPPIAPTIPSKMDRYFEPSYDPKKDYRAMLDAQDVAVPRTGLVPDIDIGWDSMLSTIRYRGQDRERAREGAMERERAVETDRRERERERYRERYSRSSREKERQSGGGSSSKSKKSTSDKKRSRREERSPSIISIRDSSDEDSSSESGSSWSSSSSRRPHKKRKHESSSKRSKGDEARDKDRGSKKSSGSSKHRKSEKGSSKRRRNDSDESENERERRRVVVGGYEYVSKGAVREWDKGK